MVSDHQKLLDLWTPDTPTDCMRNAKMLIREAATTLLSFELWKVYRSGKSGTSRIQAQTPHIQMFKTMTSNEDHFIHLHQAFNDEFKFKKRPSTVPAPPPPAEPAQPPPAEPAKALPIADAPLPPDRPQIVVELEKQLAEGLDL